MLLNILILFLSTFIAGAFLSIIPKKRPASFKHLLVFAGSYLFSITIIHLLPEIFRISENFETVGFFVLLGFFLQVLLEHFTSGIEHGHLHHKNHFQVKSIFLLSALCLHAFLEGTLLAHPNIIQHHHGSGALLIGIILHKVPAALALMSVLLYRNIKRPQALLLLFIFALASPMGLFLSDYLITIGVISEKTFIALFALVGGNFLHISTTIFFESSPEHKLNLSKLVMAVIGALVAVFAESLI
ncbi:ZIP family metal transporter [Fulvivirgaceae bacterium BMA10]|uniref:ZIP family metal transporter n=1 Tax=Splendidivirga corallicola TaxID=3051826 RepID=A0ABT8KMA7_9BACT|nr:ZIP family metal transporter [Fulvivirgaceae bacterium BMA10]